MPVPPKQFHEEAHLLELGLVPDAPVLPVHEVALLDEVLGGRRVGAHLAQLHRGDVLRAGALEGFRALVLAVPALQAQAEAAGAAGRLHLVRRLDVVQQPLDEVRVRVGEGVQEVPVYDLVVAPLQPPLPVIPPPDAVGQDRGRLADVRPDVREVVDDDGDEQVHQDAEDGNEEQPEPDRGSYRRHLVHLLEVQVAEHEAQGGAHGAVEARPIFHLRAEQEASSQHKVDKHHEHRDEEVDDVVEGIRQRDLHHRELRLALEALHEAQCDDRGVPEEAQPEPLAQPVDVGGAVDDVAPLPAVRRDVEIRGEGRPRQRHDVLREADGEARDDEVEPGEDEAKPD
mmetsp:Transcript_9434/g.20657  ORF Transcript_9434/g.20657 Transcript_9434/m.20657 type:complete len:342 (+) Transcript_9434:486-1511(+)